MSTILISAVDAVGISRTTGKLSFVLRNVPAVEFVLREEDEHRVEAGDVVHVEIPGDIYPWNGDPSRISEDDKVSYKLRRVSKGGNPAFQG